MWLEVLILILIDILKMDPYVLPDGLEMRQLKTEDNAEGVFALVEFDIGTIFGPYKGEKVAVYDAQDGRDTTYMWEVHHQYTFLLLVSFSALPASLASQLQ